MRSSNIFEEKKISVVIPCYNQARYLPDALRSVLAQTYNNWECIIVNDGSSDDTEQVSQEWLKKDNRFRYLHKQNGGLSSARNAGLMQARGEYMQFLDADDVLHPEKFAIQIRLLENTADNALSISDYFCSLEFDLEQAHPNRYLSPKFKTRDYISELILDWEARLSIPVHAFLFKTSIFKNGNIRFNESLSNHEDWDCWMNIFKLKPEVLFAEDVLATYRIRESAMCADTKSMTRGWLEAITLQMKTFPKKSVEFQLLSKKYKEIKAGIEIETSYLSLFLRILKHISVR
jgi:glycosyltransferase involved in cell wall biosynthesis